MIVHYFLVVLATVVTNALHGRFFLCRAKSSRAAKATHFFSDKINKQCATISNSEHDKHILEGLVTEKP